MSTQVQAEFFFFKFVQLDFYTQFQNLNTAAY